MDKGAGRDVFDCPSYKTLTRNPVDGKPTGGYIFTAGLKTCGVRSQALTDHAPAVALLFLSLTQTFPPIHVNPCDEQ